MHNHSNSIMDDSSNHNENTFTNTKSTTSDLEKENRLAKIIELVSKGLTQAEIAAKLNVNQSTICRDIKYLQGEAKGKIRKYLDEDILFEFM